MNKLLIFLMVAGLSACTYSPRRGLPPVVDNSSRIPASEASSGVQAYPLPDSEAAEGAPLEPLEGMQPVPLPDSGDFPPSRPRPRTGNNAVVALLDRADQYGQSGQTDAAAEALERALRIEPRNARLWSRLAAVRLQQGQPEQAEQLALKSNALSSYDRQLQAENWQIVARARWARNDETGARRAEQKVRELGARR